jgi:hypothetical protein
MAGKLSVNIGNFVPFPKKHGGIISQDEIYSIYLIATTHKSLKAHNSRGVYQLIS